MDKRKHKGPNGGAKSERSELVRLYIEDQHERMHITKLSGADYERAGDLLEARDRRRLARVKEMLRIPQRSWTRHELVAAAMICQHGDAIEDYALAHLLALEASRRPETHPTLRMPDPLWLAAAAKDRWLIRMGMPQDFGTQFPLGKGRRRDHRFSVNPAITDEERAAWHVPPIGE